MPDQTRKVEFVPPSQDVLVHFAQTVGDELGVEYADSDIVQGLADFMGVVARVLAHDLNRKRSGEFDSRIE